MGVAVKILIGGIDDSKDIFPLSSLKQFLPGKLLHLQVVAFADHLGNLMELVWYLLWHSHPILHIVVVLLETA